eukprot:scaffold1762_cov383-Prasinococcus_capsulatus_cf.AAC.15
MSAEESSTSRRSRWLPRPELVCLHHAVPRTEQAVPECYAWRALSSSRTAEGTASTPARCNVSRYVLLREARLELIIVSAVRAANLLPQAGFGHKPHHVELPSGPAPRQTCNNLRRQGRPRASQSGVARQPPEGDRRLALAAGAAYHSHRAILRREVPLELRVPILAVRRRSLMLMVQGCVDCAHKHDVLLFRLQLPSIRTRPGQVSVQARRGWTRAG